MRKVYVICNLVILFWMSSCFAGESKFVVLIASYNNATFVEGNVKSALNQNYDNFRIIYVDDASTDGTDRVLAEVLQHSDKAHLVKVIRNKTSQRTALANQYYAIHNEIADDEIVVILDGDDKLSNSEVLAYLDKVYSSKDKKIWLTYGQFRGIQSGQVGFCCEYPKEIIEAHAFRKYEHMPSHLRTFYAWLFKNIQKEDLMYKGDFFRMTGDLAMMLPMIEMAANHYQFISEVLYDYNERNNISDHVVDNDLQAEMAMYIRNLKPYASLD